MKVIRYCGEVRIAITYVAPRCGTEEERAMMARYPHGRYKCNLSASGMRATVWTAPPACLSDAVDSPRAFADTARAALAFTDGKFDGFAHFDDDSGGYLIKSSKPSRVA